MIRRICLLRRSLRGSLSGLSFGRALLGNGWLGCRVRRLLRAHQRHRRETYNPYKGTSYGSRQSSIHENSFSARLNCDWQLGRTLRWYCFRHRLWRNFKLRRLDGEAGKLLHQLIDAGQFE